MAIDTGVFTGPTGSLRLFTLILGAIDCGITADSYYNGVRDEDFFFWTVVVLLIVSVILAVVALLGIHNDAVFVRKGDYVYHFIGGIVLLIAGILMLISVFHYGNQHTTGKYVERIAAGVIGILNALIYCSLGWSTCRS
jgi:hypothetical protein